MSLYCVRLLLTWKSISRFRRVGRIGYCTGLENRRPKGLGGSSPSLSVAYLPKEQSIQTNNLINRGRARLLPKISDVQGRAGEEIIYQRRPINASSRRI